MSEETERLALRQTDQIRGDLYAIPADTRALRIFLAGVLAGAVLAALAAWAALTLLPDPWLR